jgi:hypothetical protein
VVGGSVVGLVVAAAVVIGRPAIDRLAAQLLGPKAAASPNVATGGKRVGGGLGWSPWGFHACRARYAMPRGRKTPGGRSPQAAVSMGPLALWCFMRRASSRGLSPSVGCGGMPGVNRHSDPLEDS